MKVVVLTRTACMVCGKTGEESGAVESADGRVHPYSYRHGHVVITEPVETETRPQIAVR